MLIIHLKRFRQVGKSSVLVRKAVMAFLTVGCRGILQVSLFDVVCLSMVLHICPLFLFTRVAPYPKQNWSIL